MQELKPTDSNEEILRLVLNSDELSWQNIIYDLVKSERMDPWDINISLLTEKFLETITKLRKYDFRVSGKIVLASALLLKIKSERLLKEDINALEELLSDEPEDIDMFFDIEEYEQAGVIEPTPPKIFPRTPQPRQRKVSVYDLVTALEHALEMSTRRERRALDNVNIDNKIELPSETIDVTVAMNNLLDKITTHYQTNTELFFHQLTEGLNKQGVVLTFIPLLHLTNERRIDLEQPEHFKEITIKLLSSTKIVSDENA